MVFEPRRFFEGVRYVGRVRAVRQVYHVYDTSKGYLLVYPSGRGPRDYFLVEVPRALVERVRHRFRARVTTSIEVRDRLRMRRQGAMTALRALYVLTALGQAKIKGRQGLSLAFRVLA